MKDIKIALVPIARVTFDMELADKVTRQFRSQLISNGLKVIDIDEMVTSLDAARAAANALSTQDYDLLLIFQATFADSTMLVSVAESTDKPIFLWAIPDERAGGRLRLNSLCGINLGAHALTLRKIPYDFAYAPVDDPQSLRKVASIAAASRVKSRLLGARLGVIGEHPDGMDTCHLDAPALERSLGVHVERIELEEVFDRVRAMDPDEVEPTYSQLNDRLANLNTLDQPAINRSLRSYRVFGQLARERNLKGLAIRCWPEFFTDLGCSACGALSMMTNDRVPCSCEADINGTITSLILQWLSDEPAFGSDLVAVDYDADEIVLWHCGQAPLAMADPNVQPRATIHSNRNLPLLMEFTLKPGVVTVARLSQATGELRLVVGSGEMIAAPPSFSGTSGVLRMNRPARQVLDTILSEGLEHHLSLTYGDHLDALLELAEMLDLPVLRL